MGEATSYELTVAGLTALVIKATEAETVIDAQAASLEQAGLDPTTLGLISDVLEAATGLRVAAQAALADVQNRHGAIHEAAVNAGGVATDGRWYLS